MTDHAHSPWGGSSIGRILACPGSYTLSQLVPPAPESEYAREGTVAHGLAEYCLRHMQPPTDFIGMTLDGTVDAPEITKEMADAVQVYYDEVNRILATDKDAVLLVEQKLVLEVAAVPSGAVFGRVDCIIYLPSLRKVVVIDYKHGAGVSVQVEDNSQGKFYGAAAVLAHPDWPLREVEILIVQPRARDVAENGAVKRWTWDPVDLLDFVSQVDDGIAKALEANAPVAEGSHCRWCPAQMICPSKTGAITSALGLTQLEGLEPAKLPAIAQLTPERLGELLRAGEILSGWFSQLKDYAEGQLRAGYTVPGWALKEKQARRRWAADDQDVAGYVSTMYGVPVDLITPPKLVGITEMERILAQHLPDRSALKAAKDDVSIKFTVKESSGLTLARVDDGRPAYNAGAAFSNVSGV